MHVGNARTALFNYLFARKHGGTFILRIEDTDIERHSEEAVELILRVLRWMGIEWDEGPYRQSERLEIYREYVEKLKEKGLVYECYCTKEELEEMKRRQLERGEPPRYTGKCRNLSEREKRERIERGIRPALRFKVNEDEVISFEDEIRGKITISAFQLGGDFVIVRSNGMPVYNFTVVIDDALMNITHVIRGEDHISNTPKQILLYKSLGFKIPRFAHLPMILGKDRSKLSKRHGAVSVEEFINRGYLPEAFVNFLALLGWYPKDGKEILSMEELIERFDLKSVNRAGAIFDTAKLDWMNQVYMKKLSSSQILELSKKFFEKEGINVEDKREFVEKVIEITRDYYKTLSDVPVYVKEFLTDDVKFTDEVLKFFKEKPERVKVVEEFLNELKSYEGTFNASNFMEISKKVGKKLGVKGKELFMPLRGAITGKLSGVEIQNASEVLGKERVIKRLENFLNRGLVG
jgi:glutamyl-tRNA synthetase